MTGRARSAVYRVSVVKPGVNDGGNWSLLVRPPCGVVDQLGKPLPVRRVSSGTRDHAEALRRAEATAERLNALTVKRPDPTVAEVVRTYATARSDLRATTQANVRSALKAVSGGLGEVRASALNRAALLLERDRLQARELKPRTINLYLKTLKTGWTWCRDRDLVSVAWPSGVKSLKPGKVKKRPFKDAEVAALLEWARTYSAGKWRAVFAVAADTGLRIDEVCSLRWLDIDREGSRVRVDTGKTDEDTWVACPRATIAELPAPKVCSSWVFVGTSREGRLTRSGAYCALRAGMKALGIETYTVDLHSFRRYTVWAQIANGVDLGTSMAQVRHASPDLHAHYQAQGDRDLLGSVEGVRARRERLPKPSSMGSTTETAPDCSGAVTRSGLAEVGESGPHSMPQCGQGLLLPRGSPQIEQGDSRRFVVPPLGSRPPFGGRFGGTGSVGGGRSGATGETPRFSWSFGSIE